MMLKNRKGELPQNVEMSKLGEKLNLGGKYYDKALKKLFLANCMSVCYNMRRVNKLLLVSYFFMETK